MHTFSLEAGLGTHPKDEVVRAAAERQKTSQELVKKASEAPNVIGQGRVLLVPHTFRSHILRRAYKVDMSVPPLIVVDLHLANLAILQVLSRPQIYHHYALAIFRPEHILRLQNAGQTEYGGDLP